MTKLIVKTWSSKSFTNATQYPVMVILYLYIMPYAYSITGCPDFQYGVNCQFTCGHCENDETCDPVTGVCPSGCVPGFTGISCNQGNSKSHQAFFSPPFQRGTSVLLNFALLLSCTLFLGVFLILTQQLL